MTLIYRNKQRFDFLEIDFMLDIKRFLNYLKMLRYFIQ
nr:MAG TPA: hypothetical protein [Caudoviricetes sp.]